MMKVKCQVKAYGCVSCPGRLATIYVDFGTRAVIISGRYPVPRYSVSGCPVPFDIEFDLEGQMHGQRSWLCSCPDRLAVT